MRAILGNRGLAVAGLLALHQGLSALEKPALPVGMTAGLSKIGLAGNVAAAAPVGVSWLAWALIPAIVAGGLAGWWMLAQRGANPTAPHQGLAGTEAAMPASPAAQDPPTTQAQEWNWQVNGGLPYRIEEGHLRIGLRNPSSKIDHLTLGLGRPLPAGSTISMRCLVTLPKAGLICTFGLGIGSESEKEMGAASWAVVVDRSRLTIKADWDTDGFLSDLGILYRLGKVCVPAQEFGNIHVDGGPHRFEIRHDGSGVHGSIDGVSLGTFVPEEGMGGLTPCLTVRSAPGQDSDEEFRIDEVTIDHDGSAILSDFSTLTQRIP